MKLIILILYNCSPSGKLVQIEYALAAVAAGGTSVGIKGKIYKYFLLKGYVLPYSVFLLVFICNFKKVY